MLGNENYCVRNRLINKTIQNGIEIMAKSWAIIVFLIILSIILSVLPNYKYYELLELKVNGNSQKSKEIADELYKNYQELENISFISKLDFFWLHSGFLPILSHEPIATISVISTKNELRMQTHFKHREKPSLLIRIKDQVFHEYKFDTNEETSYSVSEQGLKFSIDGFRPDIVKYVQCSIGIHFNPWLGEQSRITKSLQRIISDGQWIRQDNIYLDGKRLLCDIIITDYGQNRDVIYVHNGLLIKWIAFQTDTNPAFMSVEIFKYQNHK